MVFYILICTIISIYGGLNYYIGLWFWNHVGVMLPLLNMNTYWIVFSIIVIATFIGIIWNNYLPQFLQDGFYLIASYWLAATAYLTIFITVINLIYLLDRWLYFIPTEIRYNKNILFLTGLFILIVVGILLVYGTINANNLKIKPYNINISKRAGSLEKLHIALLSDIHLSDLNDRRISKLIDKINGLEPDLVLIAGDIIDSNRDKVESYDFIHMEYDFKKIKSKYGVYASLGNHDYDHRGDSAYRIDNFKQAGVNILRDCSVKIEDSFYLIGREDKSYEGISREKRKELGIIMKEMDKELPIILMDHQPINLEEPKKQGVDLQVSGHTHKGQFFPFNLITKKVFQIDYGHLKIGNFQIIVSSGARTWGPPVRIGSHSEIVDIMINFQ